MFMDLLAFSLVILMCSIKFNLGSRVRPNILGFLTVGIVSLLMVSVRVVLNSSGSVVNRVAVDLEAFNCRSLSKVHWNRSFRYGCKFCSAVL